MAHLFFSRYLCSPCKTANEFLSTESISIPPAERHQQYNTLIDPVLDRLREEASCEDKGNDSVKDIGTHVTMLDIGGELKFLPLISTLLRNDAVVVAVADLSVLARMIPDQDNHKSCLMHLLRWLDGITACTSNGPVLIALPRADVEKEAEIHRQLSDHILQTLSEREHPILNRLVLNNDLVFFPVDATKGLDGVGISDFRSTLCRAIEDSTSVRQVVPLPFFQFQDMLAALSTFPVADENSALSAFRKGSGPVSHISLKEAATIFCTCVGRSFADDVTQDREFRLYLDFLHMQGAISHSNAPALEDLVVVDPMWQLQMIVRVVRVIPSTLVWSLHEVTDGTTN